MTILDSFRLNGRTALITGSSGGIGLALARALGQAGARVILNGRNVAKLEAAALQLREEGLLVGTWAFDVTDDWHTLMRTNLDSAYFVGKAVAQKMIPRRRGKIINVCSVQSELGRPGIAPYTASKGALKMLTKGMAIDWGPYGINVNGLGPGYFKTDLTEKLVADPAFTTWLVGRTPSRRWGDVQELGGAVVFLASEAAGFVNGHILYVDGGVTATL